MEVLAIIIGIISIPLFAMVLLRWYEDSVDEDIEAERRRIRRMFQPPRPILKGEDLEAWMAIYHALSTLYQHSWQGDETITEMTWNRWSNLSGKPQWQTKTKGTRK